MLSKHPARSAAASASLVGSDAAGPHIHSILPLVMMMMPFRDRPFSSHCMTQAAGLVCHPDQKLQMADSYQEGGLLLILIEGDGVLVCRCLSPCILPVGAAGLDGPDHLHGGQVIMVMSAGAGCKGVAGPEDRESSPHLQTFFNPCAVGASQGAKKLTSGKCVLLLRRPMIFHASLWSAIT